MKLSSNIEKCDINNGMYLPGAASLKRLTYALYYAVEKTLPLVRIIGQALAFSFPSGLSIVIIDANGQLQDFRYNPAKYWAVKVGVGLSHMTIPLPRVNWSNIWSAVFPFLDVPVYGSENWNYYDEVNNLYKPGTDFTPVRKYRLLSDGWEDNKYWLIALAIIYLLYKLKLFSTVQHFIQKYMNWKKQKNRDHLQQQIYAETKEANDDIDGLITSVTGLDLENDEIKDRLNSLIERLGVRLAFL